MKRRAKIPLILAVVCGVCALFFGAWVWFTPFDDRLLSAQNITSTRIVDRYGRGLREVLGSSQGRARQVELEQISDHLINATVHAEDRRFWAHSGVDPLAIGRASWQNMRNLEVISGASTLTQQVVKLLRSGNASRNLLNKFSEAVLAIRLEKSASKQEILAQYLNRAPYGNQLFGVSAASWMYFDKPPAQLSLAEAALLAGIPRAPSLYNPYEDLAGAKKVQERILNLMRERGVISAIQYETAVAEKLVILRPDRRVLAPHFSEYVLTELRNRGAEDDLNAHPKLIRTTLDLDLQKTVQDIVRAELSLLEKKNVHQAAVVILDTQTSEVLAWVGSQDYWAEEHGGANDGVLALRQPGSALKPFVFGAFFEQGYRAAETLADFPTEFPTEKGVYIPKNYDRAYHGPVSARAALASSLNIPAVMVAQTVGVKKVLDTLRDFGMDTFDQDDAHYGLGVALGNGEVRLRDLTAAYATLGRLGTRKELRIFLDDALPAPTKPTFRTSVKDAQIFSPETAYILMDILSDDAARAQGFGRYSALYFPYRVAAKTGTSDGFRDNWTFAVTPEYTIGVWAGNFDASPMQRSSGITGAAPIMRQVTQALYPDAANAGDVPWFPRPDAVETHRVCTLSGHKPGPHCPTTRLELFSAEAAPEEACAIHKSLAIDTRNGLLASPECPAEFVRDEVFTSIPPDWVDWARRRGERLPPTRTSGLCH
ncbi:penicillin-binding protein 1C [Bradymonas sediminis]|uniref:peptidoglycan glycosyltransferase n=1 Tax=Bradymonas sediminis TaxID=1548548 RepID=A0A2Z4FLY7_9DELT|nr:penicillin-binding protein 1C [Bradymonas sediminis]TDP76571.1 penicillin-binding protein 1C [Bradymonas sediminis]